MLRDDLEMLAVGNREMRRAEERRREDSMTMLAEVDPQVTQYRGVQRRRGQWTLEKKACQTRTSRRWNLVSPTI